MSSNLTIGLFGFGTVGEGIYRVLQQTPTLNATIKKICIKHPEKKRNADPHLFTTYYNELLDDPEINLIVELIDDADEAFVIVSTALQKRKAVVTANKKMIAEHFPALLKLQQDFETPLLYEGAVCGSIPIIRNLEEYYDNDLLQSVCGIVNGSTNYILTRIKEDKKTYHQALLEAQQLGFAESNPALDVEGVDAVNKLTILLAHAYGIVHPPQELLFKGITQLNDRDAAFADEKGYQIKLIAQGRKLSDGTVAAFVLPHYITDESQLFYVKDEFNGIVIESKLADKQFLYGKGAGRYPTSSAVLSDIAALRYQYKYEYRKLNSPEKATLAKNYYLKVYVSFERWEDINKNDFEQVVEFYSTGARQYLVGVIHVEKLQNASWLNEPSVSVIMMPNGIIEKDVIVTQSLKKVSLHLAGVI
ncbi:MAG: homoserine dehydrogenase [Flavisolibacter sp.]|nr:homoserine dehydrogenase [Flavisolibacter sp.]